MTHLHMTWLMCMSHDSCIYNTLQRTCIALDCMHTYFELATCDMTNLHMTWLMCMWHDSSMNNTFQRTCTALGCTHVHLSTCHVWYRAFTHDMTHTHVTWLIHMHVYVWYDSYTHDMTHVYVTWLIHIQDVTTHLHCARLYAHTFKHLTHVIWLIVIWHDSCTCHITDPYATHRRDMTHSHLTWLMCM